MTREDGDEADGLSGNDLYRAGEAYLAQFDFNLKVALEDLHRRTEAARLADREVVSYPSKRISPHLQSTKKAG